VSAGASRALTCGCVPPQAGRTEAGCPPRPQQHRGGVPLLAGRTAGTIWSAAAPTHP